MLPCALIIIECTQARDFFPFGGKAAAVSQDENCLTVRNRMKAAAGRRGLDINFRRTSGDLIRFQITEQSNGNSKSVAAAPVEPPPVVSSEPPATPKRKGGRPKKSAAI
jgi:hypothetical protein